MTRVLVVDDHPSIRRGLTELFSAEPDLEVCGHAGSGEAALVLAVTLIPDVVVMDLAMPGMGGVAATRAIIDSGCSSNVLVLTWSWSEDAVRSAVAAGAKAYVLKSEGPQRLIDSVRAVARGQVWPGPDAGC